MFHRLDSKSLSINNHCFFRRPDGIGSFWKQTNHWKQITDSNKSLARTNHWLERITSSESPVSKPTAISFSPQSSQCHFRSGNDARQQNGTAHLQLKWGPVSLCNRENSVLAGRQGSGQHYESPTHPKQSTSSNKSLENKSQAPNHRFEKQPLFLGPQSSQFHFHLLCMQGSRTAPTTCEFKSAPLLHCLPFSNKSLAQTNHWTNHWLKLITELITAFFVNRTKSANFCSQTNHCFRQPWLTKPPLMKPWFRQRSKDRIIIIDYF